MDVLLLVLGSGALLLAAYLTYGRWLARRVFRLDDANPTPASTQGDDRDFIKTARSIVFGHHFTSIAGTGPIVGPAIAVLWGWLPALLWVLIGSIFIGAVHDLGSLVVSLRNKGRSIGDIAGQLLGHRARLLFLCILVVALWIVLAVFGLVITAVLKAYPSAIFPVVFQIPLALAIGLFVHRRGKSIVLPSILAITLMFLSVWASSIAMIDSTSLPLRLIAGVNESLRMQPQLVWIVVLMCYAYLASVLPVWTLLQPRDYINALQLIACLGLVVIGLVAAAIFGGAPPEPVHDQLAHAELSIVAPMIDWQPIGAPPLFPILFITVACGACSGFHCLVASGTTSKQLAKETDAKPVGYGGMLTEGFLATIVIAACIGGLGLGMTLKPESRGVTTVTLVNPNPEDQGNDDMRVAGLFTRYLFRSGDENRFLGVVEATDRVEDDGSFSPLSDTKPFIRHWTYETDFENDVGTDRAALISSERAESANLDLPSGRALVSAQHPRLVLLGQPAYETRYASWQEADSLGAKVGAFVDGAANLLAAAGLPLTLGTALMAVFVASFAATTMDTTARLQRYVVQELASTFLPPIPPTCCPQCGYDCAGLEHAANRPTDPDAPDTTVGCPECGNRFDPNTVELTEGQRVRLLRARTRWYNPCRFLSTARGATLSAVLTASMLAIMPRDLDFVNFDPLTAGGGGLILWPIFGATNQLLAGFAFVVILAWLRVRGRPWWFAVLPAIVMLVVPALAMAWQALIGNAQHPSYLEDGQWLLLAIAVVALALEAWLIVEALLHVRRGTDRFALDDTV